MAKNSGVGRLIAWALRHRLVRAYLTYSEHRGSMLADSVTYRALFSIFAGVLLGFSIFALLVGGNPEAIQTLAETLDNVIPGLSRVVDPTQIQAEVGFSLVGIASMVGLIVAAIGAIASLRVALRELADELHDDGNIVWVYLRNLIVAVGFSGLILIAAALSTVVTVGVEQIATWFGLSIESDALQVASQGFGILVILIVDMLAITLVFTMLSGFAASKRALFQGALLGAVGLIVLQTLSGLFVRGATSNPLLATFSVLIALLLWVNLSIQVVLITSSYIIVTTREEHDRVREAYGAQTLNERRVKRAQDLVNAATKELRAAEEALLEESSAEHSGTRSP